MIKINNPGSWNECYEVYRSALIAVQLHQAQSDELKLDNEKY